ncbi:ABC transporter permease [Corynebacterium uberis]|uniref:ABC transporter permease n=1 Tax=Corynebacterium TaxID=1716 RepID=UPI001D09A94F|nr:MULTISPECIES: ABC transporter permease [Corynebacterium]MCZ9309913.1 ABC transporter permease [Corynebacterium sp. c6VSa_13]UDL73167.1 ABC transporter permease [Corynebacterium uberis]UDL75956.1 ABC transporter permease [Corynebacterium uberis]UDL78168.1 ABC transporter permease [Corynebacterium uberis]UDL80451.1 ABC transporter permease [Corynebacterium uberis]
MPSTSTLTRTASGMRQDASWAATAAAHFTRHLRAARRDSAVVMNTLAVPFLMFMVMRWLFGDLIAASQGTNQLDLLPLTIALILSCELMNGTSAAAHILRERQRGITARIATTRYGTAPEMLGRWGYDGLRSALSGCSVLVAALLSGLRIHSWAGAGWILVVIVLGAMTAASLSAAVGAMGSTPESAMGPAPIIMAAMTLNGGLVPVERFAGVVQPLARWNPLTFAVRAATTIDGSPASQILEAGQPGAPVWMFLIWMVGLTVVLLAAAGTFRRPVMS